MPNYYTRQDGEIEAGHLAKAEDINAIQDEISSSLAQLISDNFGDAYVLDDEEDVFEMIPAVSVYDQSSTSGSNWQSLYDYYVRQTIEPKKSSIESISIIVRNTSETSRTLRTELRTYAEDMNDSELIATYDVNIPGSTSGVEYELIFNVNHLTEDKYFFVAKRVDIDGIDIQYNETSPYNSSMAISDTGEEYDIIETGGDIWFKTRFGSTQTYIITSGVAVIHGEKIHNMDTHVTIPPRSGYGDRIDIVTMNKEGEFEVVQGEVSTTTPTAPIEEVEYGKLKIAYVTVPKDTTKPLVIDQVDTYGKSRKRSHEERLRRLEKKTSWMFEYNAPERIKYNLTGSSFYGSSSNMSPIIVNGVTTGYQLGSFSTVEKYWSFRDFGGTPPIVGEYEGNDGIASFTDLDHSDHVNGVVTLAPSITTSNWFSTWVAKEKRYKPVSIERTYNVWNNGSYYSQYPAAFFNISSGRQLQYIRIDSRFYRNVKGVHLVLFKINGTSQRDYRYIMNSAYYDLSSRSPGAYGIVKTEVLQLGFGGVWLDPGKYCFLLVATPKNKKQACKVWTNTINYKGRTTSFGVFTGWFPPKIPTWDSGNKKYGVTKTKQLAETFIFDMSTTTTSRVTQGTITSSTIHTDYGISSVAIDMNLSLPTGTLYTLEVSNDGGTTYTPMTGTLLNFSATSGQDFKWRLTLKTNNIDVAPILSYSASKQYAIKFTLGLTGGAPATSGYIRTIGFDGPEIVRSAIQVGAGIDKFSHWEWLRLWMKENAGTITVDIEANDTNTTTGPWTAIKSGLTLEDLYNGSIDYSDYEGSYEEDEYNYYCDVDAEVLLEDRVLLESCDAVWNDGTKPANVNYVADTSTKIEGTASFKMEMNTYNPSSTEMIAIKELDLNMSVYDTISFSIRPFDTITSGSLQFCIGTNTECTQGEFHDIPALTADVWNTVTIKLSNPEALNNVQAFGIKRIIDVEHPQTEWNDIADGIRIDYIEGYVRNTTVIDNCDTAWTSGQAAVTASADTSVKQVGIASAKFITTTPTTASPLGYRTVNLELTNYNQIRFWIRSTVALSAGDLKVAFCSDTAGATPITSNQLYTIPAIDTTSTWYQVTIDLENPEELTGVKSLSIKFGVAKNSATINIDNFEALKTAKYPFYQKYVRFKINMSRANGADPSPTIRKVGVVPILT